MYKNKAVMVAVIIAIIAIFVVFASTSVFKDDSKERYGEVSSPESEAMMEETEIASTAVKDESTEPLAQNEAGGVNETVTEHMEDSQEAVPETVVEEEVEATPMPTEELQSKAGDMMAEAESAAAGMAEDAQTAAADIAKEAEQAVEEAKQAASGGEMHIVTAQGLKYSPLVIQIQPGDTVAWENMPTHDTQSIEGLIPEGAEAWHSELGKNYERTFSQEGIYVYKCTPHIGAGMGGAIIVGNPVNLDAIKAADAKGAEGRLARKAIAAAEAM
jgi:pseudoazurin